MIHFSFLWPTVDDYYLNLDDYGNYSYKAPLKGESSSLYLYNNSYLELDLCSFNFGVFD
jgi:hypothetical protein